MRRHHPLAAILVAILFSCGQAQAADPFVAIVAAATNSSITTERFTDLRDVLLDDGRFSGIDIISTTRFGTGTPSLNDLMQYDAIIHWTNDSNDDSEALGNVFADYVDAGGGVVQAVFANTSSNPDRFLRGRWLTGNYNILPPSGGFVQGTTPGDGDLTETAIMDDPLEPNHPIFDGVGEVRLSTGMFQGGGLFGAWRPATTGLEPNARKLALWEDGKTAVAASDLYPNRIDLGLHPVSDRVNDGYYDITSDASRLIANSLLFVAGTTVSGDFNGDAIYDCLDIDALMLEIAAGTNSLDFDLTGDGNVDLGDRDAWLAEAGAVNLPSGNPYLVADFSLDGVVDAIDFTIWNGNKFTANAAWCGGNSNGDGFVDATDFLDWNANKFQASDATLVPEPATGMWCLLLCWLLPARRYGRVRSELN